MTCNSAEIHINDVGTRFNIAVVDGCGNALDISTATSILLNFQKPDNTEISKVGTLTTDGTDGLFYYITEDGFLNVSGIWQIQAYVAYSGSHWYSNINRFKVKDNI